MSLYSFAVDILLTMTLVVILNLAVIQSALATAHMEVSWKLMLLESTSGLMHHLQKCLHILIITCLARLRSLIIHLHAL